MTRTKENPVEVTFQSVCGATITFEGWYGTVVVCRNKACRVTYLVTPDGAQSHYKAHEETYGDRTVILPIQVDAPKFYDGQRTS